MTTCTIGDAPGRLDMGRLAGQVPRPAMTPIEPAIPDKLLQIIAELVGRMAPESMASNRR